MGGAARIVQRNRVWAALDKCAPGHQRTLKLHHWWIDYNGRSYKSFPKGKGSTTDPDIEAGHVRKMARHLDIYKCIDEALF